MANNSNYSLVDFFNAFRKRHTYDKYTQDGSYKTTDYSKWSSADVNGDGKLNIQDGAAIEKEYNTISKTKTIYDITQDGEVKFDDLLGFSEEMDIDGNGNVCQGEKELLKGRTRLVFAQVKENLENDQNFKLNDLMDYSKAVSNLDDTKKQSLNNEIATLEETMINKLRAQNLKDGDINDLKSFWSTTKGANQLNLGHESKLMSFLDETETGLRTNVKKADSAMTDQKLDTMKQEIQGTAQNVAQAGSNQPQNVAGDCGCGETPPPVDPTPSPTATPSATTDPDCPGFTCRHNPPTPTQPTVPTPTCPTPTCPTPTQPTVPTPTCPTPTCPTPTQPTVPTPTCPTPTQPTVPTPTCPTPTCPTQPTFNPQPMRPQRPGMIVDVNTNINNGIIDGPGNDIYDGQGNDIYAIGNSGIIDTQGNDIYARNYTVNTYNVTNNYYPAQPTVPTEPTVPTVPTEPTVPTVPTEPTVPTVPTEPTVPTVPTEPTIPTVPTEPTIPTVPTEPTTPTVPTEPTTPTVPEPTAPSAPAVINLTPLRNLLTGIEKLTPDGVLSDTELAKAMNNPHYANLDGDNTTISDEEMAIFNKIRDFNVDKTLLSKVMFGDYSNIDDATMQALGELSDEIKNLTQRR